MGEYYRLDGIDKHNAKYNLIYGKKANGKSYAVRERALVNHFMKDFKFVYLRRRKEEIENEGVEDYFIKAIPIIKMLSNNHYSGVFRYGHKIYLLDQEGKRTKHQIGYSVILSKEHLLKSRDYAENTNMIIFEEFLTRGLYLKDEWKYLQEFVSTVLRNDIGKIYMIGNTVRKYNPYIKGMGLTNFLTQKPGTIDDYILKNREGIEIKIACEYCASTQGKEQPMIIDDSMITGDWEGIEIATLEEDQLKKSNLHYGLEFNDGLQKFNLMLMSLDGVLFILIESADNIVHHEFQRKIGLPYSSSLNLMEGLYFEPKRFRIEGKIIELLKQKRIFFADEKIGNEFLLGEGGKFFEII